MFRPVIFVAALLLGSLAAPAQTSSTWDVYGGLAVLRNSSLGGPGEYDYGWAASVANRPYMKYPWVGGMVEGAGFYTKASGTFMSGPFTSYSHYHTAMAGPVVEVAHGPVRPFAHVLVGGIITDQGVNTSGAGSAEEIDDYFVHAAGGGLDLRVRHHVFFRTQADWMHIWQMPGADDSLRLSGGLVWSY